MIPKVLIENTEQQQTEPPMPRTGQKHIFRRFQLVYSNVLGHQLVPFFAQSFFNI
jgi:hypothetical protein